jgi:hypothetical protein
MTWPSRCRSTYFSAETICGKPVVPSFSEVGVSTSRMLAPGASTCDHSTSSVVSSAQVAASAVGRYRGTGPAARMTRKDGGAGSRKCASNLPRSPVMVGDPNESTMTIVSPVPVIPRAASGPVLYAILICSGVSPPPGTPGVEWMTRMSGKMRTGLTDNAALPRGLASARPGIRRPTKSAAVVAAATPAPAVSRGDPRRAPPAAGFAVTSLPAPAAAPIVPRPGQMRAVLTPGGRPPDPRGVPPSATPPAGAPPWGMTVPRA